MDHYEVMGDLAQNRDAPQELADKFDRSYCDYQFVSMLWKKE